MPKYKVGQKLYSAFLDNETGKCGVDEYIVRTVRGGLCFAVMIISGVTWGKRSKKRGDFGWANYIPEWCKSRCLQGEKFSYLYTTKRQACQAEMAETRNELKLKGEYALNADQVAVYTKGLATLKRMVKKYSKK